jgi:hypothetical protein
MPVIEVLSSEVRDTAEYVQHYEHSDTGTHRMTP